MRILERCGGLTLIETIVFILVVSIASLGVLAAVNVTLLHGSDPLVRKQALTIAESLLEEMQRMPLPGCDADDGGLAGAGWTTDDSTPCAADVAALSGRRDVTAAHAGYHASVRVEPTPLGNAAFSVPDALLITVSVTGPGNEAVRLQGYRTRYALPLP
ncbi:MAG: hypothetical protein KIS79_02540 [Burkholderiales bacterium]|nr:hypothetical protein [Burkholderiales bacterium]